jgi:hypothetical protein
VTIEIKPVTVADIESILGGPIAKPMTLSELAELEPVSATVPFEPESDSHNLIFKWNTKALHDLFGLEDWENSQLYGVLHQLNLLESENCTIAGGCIVRHLMKTDIFKGDIDIYPDTKKLAENYKDRFAAEGYTVKKTKFSYSFELQQGARKIKVQIMHDKAASMSEALNSFDFEHVRFAYRRKTFCSTLGAPVAIAQRKLHLRYVTQPDYSLIRALKYKKLGFDADKAITQLAVMINRGDKCVHAAEWEAKSPIVEY